MNTACVLTHWVAAVAGQPLPAGGNHPRIKDDYPAIVSYEDVTGQPAANLIPTPNLFTAEITCDGGTLAAIQADSNYQVLWSE